MTPPLRRSAPARISFLAIAGLLSPALASVLSCGGREVPNPFRRSANADEISISIENQGFNDARIYVVSVGGVQLLGQVPGKGNRSFTLAWRRLDDLRLRMDFLAGDTYDSNAVDAAPGDRLRLVIPLDPRSAFLRRG